MRLLATQLTNKRVDVNFFFDKIVSLSDCQARLQQVGQVQPSANLYIYRIDIEKAESERGRGQFTISAGGTRCGTNGG
jgi:hypothetical protein